MVKPYWLESSSSLIWRPISERAQDSFNRSESSVGIGAQEGLLTEVMQFDANPEEASWLPVLEDRER